MTMQSILKTNYKKISLAILSVAFLVVISVVYSQNVAYGSTENNLRGDISSIDQEIAANQEKLEELEKKEDTLQTRLSRIELEIGQVNRQIQANELKIEDIKNRLVETEKKLKEQQALLAESIAELYKRGKISTLEMLASSENFADFLSQQEYLEKLKEGIQESIDEVEKLKGQLEEEQATQEELLDRKKSNRTALSDREAEQANILKKTQGQQSKYEDVVSNLQAQRLQAEQDLNNYLASLVAQSYTNYTSLGRVSAGEPIGLVGSTGYSTGPHLHFEMRSGASTVDPGGSGGLSYGFTWPTPGNNGVSQNYGCVAPYSWYYTKCGNNMSFHAGLDISGWYGDPVVAAAAGDIIYRGWFGGYGNMVLIRHDNGIITAYGHLLE